MSASQAQSHISHPALL